MDAPTAITPPSSCPRALYGGLDRDTETRDAGKGAQFFSTCDIFIASIRVLMVSNSMSVSCFLGWFDYLLPPAWL